MKEIDKEFEAIFENHKSSVLVAARTAHKLGLSTSDYVIMVVTKGSLFWKRVEELHDQLKITSPEPGMPLCAFVGLVPREQILRFDEYIDGLRLSLSKLPKDDYPVIYFGDDNAGVTHISPHMMTCDALFEKDRAKLKSLLRSSFDNQNLKLEEYMGVLVDRDSLIWPVWKDLVSQVDPPKGDVVSHGSILQRPPYSKAMVPLLEMIAPTALEDIDKAGDTMVPVIATAGDGLKVHYLLVSEILSDEVKHATN